MNADRLQGILIASVLILAANRGSAWGQDPLEFQTHDGAGVPVNRFTVTAGVGAELRAFATLNMNGNKIANLAAAAAPGDAVRFDQLGGFAGPYVQLAPAAAQPWTLTYPGIFLNETGMGSPNLLQLQVGAADAFVVDNTGAVVTGAWKGTVIGAPYGGTGFGSYAVGDLLYASGTQALSKLSSGPAGNVLTSNGPGTAPSWNPPSSGGLSFGSITTGTNTAATMTVGAGAAINAGGGAIQATQFIGTGSSSPAVDLATAETSGILPIAKGGTNSGTGLAGSSIMISNGTAIVQGPVGSTTTVLHGNATGAPTYGAVSLTSDVSGILPVGGGGTGSNLSTTGGAGQYLKQTALGGALTVGPIAAADIPAGSTSYVQNQAAVAQAASFWINGTGRVGGAMTLDSTVVIGNASGTDRLSFDSASGVLQVGSYTPTSPQTGDLRQWFGNLYLYDGTIWKTVLTSSGSGGFLLKDAPDTSSSSTVGSGNYLYKFTCSDSGSLGCLKAIASSGEGVRGESPITGVYGLTTGTNGSFGVYGSTTGNLGSGFGIYGTTALDGGIGVQGISTSINIGGPSIGVRGMSMSSPKGIGVYGLGGSGPSAIGVFGSLNGGSSGIGIKGIGGLYGLWGETPEGTGTAIYGLATNSNGSTIGVNGVSNSSAGIGVKGTSAIGIYGEGIGVTPYGVYGVANVGSGTGVYGAGSTWGGYFSTTLGISAGGYANFGTTSGAAGYGLRDNGGAIEFKNSGGAWQALSTSGGGAYLAKNAYDTSDYSFSGTGYMYTLTASLGGGGAPDSTGCLKVVVAVNNGEALRAESPYIGVHARSTSTTGGMALYAETTGGVGMGMGVYGTSSQTDGIGVQGSATTGNINSVPVGVRGVAASAPKGVGVLGVGRHYGVRGETTIADSAAVYGYATNASLWGGYFIPNVGISANGYLNFGPETTPGSGGYGLRDNAGTMEFKNSGGAWQAIGSGGTGSFLAKNPSATEASSASVNSAYLYEFKNTTLAGGNGLRVETSGGRGIYGLTTNGVGVKGDALGTSGSANVGLEGVADFGPGENIGVAGYGGTGAGGGPGPNGKLTGIHGAIVSVPCQTSYAVKGYNESAGTSGDHYGLYGVAVGTPASGTAVHYGLFAYAFGGAQNYGVFCQNGCEMKIPDVGSSAPTMTVAGSLAAGNSGGTDRLYFKSAAANYSYVNADGTGDYSEYFRTRDRTLALGEIVAIDVENANSVRRAERSDAARIVGVVSKFGTRNNDDAAGRRGENPEFVNVGLLGQVPVLVSDENGAIGPGDPLTVGRTPGVAVKASGPCRIIGFATTHYPYVKGEVTRPDHANASEKDRLDRPHVMCFVNPTWDGTVEGVDFK